MTTTSASRRCGSRVRSIDMTGVRPLPAASMSRGRGPVGRRKSPCGGARNSRSPGSVWCTRWLETRPTAVTVIAGSWPSAVTSEYERQLRTPSISTPMRAYWPALCASHVPPGVNSIVAEFAVSWRTAVTTPRS